MVYGLLLAQVVFPLALLACLFGVQFKTRVCWLLLLAATGLLLVLLAIVGLWIVPPWWGLWAYAILWVVALGFGARRWHSMSNVPHGWIGWTSAVVTLLFAGYCAFESIGARRGRQPPPGPSLSLEFPLRDGQYLVLNGGNDLLINSHLKTRELSEAGFTRWRGNGYGVDIVALNRWGLRANGLRPEDNRAYEIFGRPVFAPCSGRVIVAVDGLPDMTPPQYDVGERLAGNHVILECGDLHVVLAHFRRGSVAVRAGDAVVTGRLLADVGNSGGTDEAHLHVHVQRPGTAEAPMGGEPIPALFFGRFLVRGDRLHVPGAL